MTLPATPIDRNAAARGSTEALESVDRPGAEHEAPSPPPLPGRYLAVEQGGERRMVLLTRPITHLGRGFGATLQLEDPGVSRRHAIVMQRHGSTRILDDRSANGTWVNGRRVHEAELSDGDVIVLGRAVLVYVDVRA